MIALTYLWSTMVIYDSVSGILNGLNESHLSIYWFEKKACVLYEMVELS